MRRHGDGGKPLRGSECVFTDKDWEAKTPGTCVGTTGAKCNPCRSLRSTLVQAQTSRCRCRAHAWSSHPHRGTHARLPTPLIALGIDPHELPRTSRPDTARAKFATNTRPDAPSSLSPQMFQWPLSARVAPRAHGVPPRGRARIDLAGGVRVRRRRNMPRPRHRCEPRRGKTSPSMKKSSPRERRSVSPERRSATARELLSLIHI